MPSFCTQIRPGLLFPTRKGHTSLPAKAAHLHRPSPVSFLQDPASPVLPHCLHPELPSYLVSSAFHLAQPHARHARVPVRDAPLQTNPRAQPGSLPAGASAAPETPSPKMPRERAACWEIKSLSLRGGGAAPLPGDAREALRAGLAQSFSDSTTGPASREGAGRVHPAPGAASAAVATESWLEARTPPARGFRAGPRSGAGPRRRWGSPDAVAAAPRLPNNARVQSPETWSAREKGVGDDESEARGLPAPALLLLRSPPPGPGLLGLPGPVGSRAGLAGRGREGRGGQTSGFSRLRLAGTLPGAHTAASRAAPRRAARPLGSLRPLTPDPEGGGPEGRCPHRSGPELATRP